MVENLGYGNALLGVCFKHGSHELLRTIGHFFLEMVLALDDHLV